MSEKEPKKFEFLSDEEAYCGWKNCKKAAIGRAFYREKSRPFCAEHLEELGSQGFPTKLYSESDATYRWWES